MLVRPPPASTDVGAIVAVVALLARVRAGRRSTMGREVMTKQLRLAKELALPADVVTQKINVLGQSGGGKTYLAMKLAELMLEHARR
jgi:ATP-dependent protease Clp ATPase subunit